MKLQKYLNHSTVTVFYKKKIKDKFWSSRNTEKIIDSDQTYDSKKA